MEKKFAFETGRLAIVFYSTFGLGDAVVARKVFEAIVELVPDCVADFYCITDAHRKYAEAFYSDIKNLNRLLTPQEYAENLQRYDLALCIGGCHVIFFEHANPQRLQALAPNFCQSLNKIDAYNQQIVYGLGPWEASVPLRHMTMAQVLHKNCFHFLSYDGALPIRDNKINIPLAPEFKPAFDNLKLDKYITIYSNIAESEKNRPKVKTWPTQCFVEYISRMKSRFPSVEIVQCGGGY